MKRYVLCITIMSLNFICLSQPSRSISNEKIESAINIAVSDFLKCRLAKNYDAFSISLNLISEYAPFPVSEEVLTVSILPVETDNEPQYYITYADSVGSSRLPTRILIIDEKLFYWHDPNSVLTGEIMDIFVKYNIAEPIEVPDLSYLLGYECNGPDDMKSVQYYFCKNNLSKYKRIITSIGIGGYKPPKLNCQ